MSPTFPALVALATAVVASRWLPPVGNEGNEGNAAGHEARPGPESSIGPRGELSLMENLGQWPGGPLFVGSLRGMRVGVVPDALLLQLFEQPGDPGRGVLLELQFEGASSSVRAEGLHERPGVTHFYLGDDPTKWRHDVRSYAQVRLAGLYEGIDLIVRSNDGGRLEYDLVVEPGADLAQVVIHCRGAESMRVDPEEGVAFETAIGPVRQPVGRSWQVSSSDTRSDVRVRYRAIDSERFGFEALDRDPSLRLVIDPELLWATYLGSVGGGAAVGDFARAVAVDGNGNVTVVGNTEGGPEGGGFPRTPGAYQSPGPPDFEDVFVTRFRQSDGELVYSCLIGGNTHDERGLAVAVDAAGRATVAGYTGSLDFPTTEGAYDETKEGLQGSDCVFVLRLSPDASELEYSTFIEGTAAGSQATGVAVAGSGAAVVGGWSSPGFPTTAGAFSTTHGGATDGFVARLDPTGSSLEWSTLLGGIGTDQLFALAIDAQENATITGNTGSPDFPTTPGAFKTGIPRGGDAFVTRLDASGSALVWSTFLGGRDYDAGAAIALHASGDTIVSGRTDSTNFPTTPGAFQEAFIAGSHEGFVTRLNASGTGLVFSTYLGSTGSEYLADLATDASGIVTVMGSVGAWDFPTTPGAFETIGNFDEMFVTRFAPDGTRLFYSSYVGGPETDAGTAMALGATGRVTLVGYSFYSGGFPTTEGALRTNYTGGQTDAVVATLDLVLEGVELFGASRPACLGPLTMNATEMPLAGASGFGLYCSGAPPLAKGLLVLGPTDTPHGSPLDGLIGVVAAISVQSDASGYVETPLPLPPSTEGLRFAARYVFTNTLGCPGNGSASTSNGLFVTVQ